MKKAQGLSLTTVVIAAVALVILIVLILIFSGRIDFFNRGASKECPPGTFMAKPYDSAAADPYKLSCNAGDLPSKIIGSGKKKEDIVYCCPNCGDAGYCTAGQYCNNGKCEP